uniref:CSON004812 protein n=1 Tax=Culicoides sonorensis TaxID=179676 RepID=A0A336MVL8_CULSO
MELICRLCLCKCENPRNMLADAEFAGKVMEVFPKIHISNKNGLSNLVCDYCHNLILQFYGYFLTVNANQDELLKKLQQVNVEEKEIEKDEIKPELVQMEIKMSPDDNESEIELEFEEDTFMENEENISDDDQQQEVIKNVAKSKIELKNLDSLNYFEIMQLPFNFTWSFQCPMCTKRAKDPTEIKSHIISSHLKNLSVKARKIEAKRLTEKLTPSCEDCGRKCLKKPKNREEHKYIHYKIKPYKCDLCDKYATAHKEILRKHMQGHLRLYRRHGCFYCDADFASDNKRNNHIHENHADKLITCDKCGLILLGRKEAKDHLKQHMKQNESNNLMLECDRCIGGIRFPNEHVLAMHKEQHTREDNYNARKKLNCHLCERRFNSENVFKGHIRYHMENKLRACTICGKTVSKDIGRKISHHAQTHLREDRTYKCEKCDEVFTTRQFLFHHIRKVHETKEISCYRCGKMIDEYLMKRHLNSCLGIKGYRCMKCPMVFEKQSERQKHNRAVHVGYRCKKCNIQFENESQLNHHQRYGPRHDTKANRAKLEQNQQNISY